MHPSSMASRPERQRRSVDLPAPFGPSTATISPAAASISTSSRSDPSDRTTRAESVTRHRRA
jgi:hypothetical protein